jgi:hypothetical protein
VLRRTILIGAGVVLLLVGAVSASGRSSADPYVGTWPVLNIPGVGDQDTPWRNGGTITIKAASRSDIMAYSDVEYVGHPVQDYCTGRTDQPPGYTPPAVSAWYLVTLSWAGTAGGCISNLTDGSVAFWGLHGGTGRVSHSTATGQLCPQAPCLSGRWTSDPDTPFRYFYAPQGPEGTTKTVSEPAPGKSKLVESPALPSDCATSKAAKSCEIEFGIRDTSENDLNYDTIAAVGGQGSGVTGLFWTCWLMYEFTDGNGKVVNLTLKQRLLACIEIVKVVACEAANGKPCKGLEQPAVAAREVRTTAGRMAPGCKTQAVPIRVRKRKGKILSVTVAKRFKDRSGVKYRCSYGGGSATISITGPSNLRKAIGAKKLPLLIVRAKKAPRASGKLSITFGW